MHVWWWLAVSTLLLLAQYPGSEAKVVGAVIMPHGGIALDPSHFKTANNTAKLEAKLVHKACLDVGVWVGMLQPDLIVLSTPHGIADLNNFAFYLNSKGFGWADTDNCACPPCCYNVSMAMDSNRSTDLAQQLQLLGANVTGVVGFGNAVPFPLAWGEVIPLYFIAPYLPPTSKLIVVSQPQRRYTDSVSMVPELLRLGATLFGYFDPLFIRVAIVISGDMAHTHLPSGPYGYSNASQPFDDVNALDTQGMHVVVVKAVGQWASTLNSTALLVTAAEYVNSALSCGFTGLVMLQGFLSAVELDKWSSHLYANYHPSYYGMMIASFAVKP